MAAASFRNRFKAWWEGYEVEAAQPREPRPAAAPRKTLSCRFEPEIEVAHMIFGEGRTLPLPEDPLQDFTQPPDNPHGMVTLLLGAETGAPALALARNYSMQTTAFEPNRNRADVANLIIRADEDAGALRVGPVDLDSFELSHNRYHLILSRLMLQRIHERDLFYRKMERALRKGGCLAPVLFVLAENVDRDSIAHAMKSALEPEEPALLTLNEEQRLLTESGLVTSIMEDITEPVLERLGRNFAVWQELVEKIARYDQQPRMLQALLALVEHWQSRMNLMKSGDLTIHHFQAEKRMNELI